MQEISHWNQNLKVLLSLRNNERKNSVGLFIRTLKMNLYHFAHAMRDADEEGVAIPKPDQGL